MISYSVLLIEFAVIYIRSPGVRNTYSIKENKIKLNEKIQQILKKKRQEIWCKANIFVKTKEDGTLTHLEGYAIGKTHTIDLG